MKPAGAGEGNRTLVVSLGSFCSTIELHPQNPHSTRVSSCLTNFQRGRYARKWRVSQTTCHWRWLSDLMCLHQLVPPLQPHKRPASNLAIDRSSTVATPLSCLDAFVETGVAGSPKTGDARPLVVRMRTKPQRDTTTWCIFVGATHHKLASARKRHSDAPVWRDFCFIAKCIPFTFNIVSR
jgi:hypothetical protein